MKLIRSLATTGVIIVWSTVYSGWAQAQPARILGHESYKNLELLNLPELEIPNDENRYLATQTSVSRFMDFENLDDLSFRSMEKIIRAIYQDNLAEAKKELNELLQHWGRGQLHVQLNEFIFLMVKEGYFKFQTEAFYYSTQTAQTERQATLYSQQEKQLEDNLKLCDLAIPLCSTATRDNTQYALEDMTELAENARTKSSLSQTEFSVYLSKNPNALQKLRGQFHSLFQQAQTTLSTPPKSENSPGRGGSELDGFITSLDRRLQ